MGRQIIMAHDLGTSGDKACLFDSEGNFEKITKFAQEATDIVSKVRGQGAP